MDRLTIERRGGLTGLQARGQIEVDELSDADRSAVEALFHRRGKLPAAPGADRFVFAITRVTGKSKRTLEVPEHLMPRGLVEVVREELP